MPDHTDTLPVRTETVDQQIARAVASNGAMLRIVLERLDELIQLLTPKPSEGPTLDELLARLVSLVSDQTVLLKRIDDRTTILLEHSGAIGKGVER